ncbi:MAG: HipA domain-containing protein [Gemmatimonadaceae bacterium]
MSTPTAFVYVDWDDATHLVGRLLVTTSRGRDVMTFLYDASWQTRNDRFALAPALAVSAAPHITTQGKNLFGALGDSAPDRWGQTLLRRDERRRASLELRAPRTLREIDFLLGVTDFVRQGALRFARSAGGEFVAPEKSGGVPPLVELPRLLAATERFLADDESADDLRLLLAPGSSLGGARPKASLRDHHGNLLIAKFPKGDDEYRMVAWEAVALRLAQHAGITVAQHRLESVAGRDVLILDRFDRHGTARIPFLSALSMLGATDGEPRSYPELADVIRQHGSAPRRDLHELWRRIVFSVLISNTDDHLRNHAFLYTGPGGWRLSPAYDINPTPIDVRPRVLSTAIAVDGDPTASLSIALEVAEYFDLKPTEARIVAGVVGAAVKKWRDVAKDLGVVASERERMATAFEHDDLLAALRLS